MKRWFFIMVLFLPFVINAQQRTIEQQVYLFEQFEKGTAVMLDGKIVNTTFNYYLPKSRFAFQTNKGDTLFLTNCNDVNYIVVNQRLFEHVYNNDFYESVEVGDNKFFYIKWESSLLPKGKSVGYGITSKTSSISTWSSIDTPSGFYKLNTGEDFDLNSDNTYYIKSQGNFVSFKTLKALIQLFPDKGDEISAFNKRNRTSFKSAESVKKLMEFCSSFIP